MFQTPYRLILASGSPRRQALLQQAGFAYEIRLKPIDEVYPESLPATEIAAYLAKQKSAAFGNSIGDNELLITADTIVALGDEVLQKPTNAEEAFNMIAKLSRSAHHVFTGVCLRTRKQTDVFTNKTVVHFLTLTAAEIKAYIVEAQPFDKAGGYGIQEWIGMLGIQRIEGSFYNVMGFPIHEFYQRLKSFE